MYLTGTIIDNRYEINSLFAEGGMSFLYRALDTRDGTTVAVKVLKPFTVSNRIEDVIRYRGAIEKISSLDNPYVARVIGTGNLAQAYGPPLHYIIMELVPAGNLHDMLAGGKSFSSDEAAETALQACRALDAVHRLGVIHGDVKPGNMLVADDGGVIRVKLIDFGLSRIKKYLESEYTGDTSGTFCYIPPEQAGIIRRGVDERSDLYSLGVVLYELLAGRLPYSGDSLVALLHQQAAKIPTAPSAYNNEVPNILDAIVLKLLAKEPGGRYQGAIGLMRDLERFLKGERDFIPGSDDAAARIDFNAAMVGRDAELARLTALLDEARGGKGMLCLISGEAGIGKTRLADEFRKWVISLGIPYIEGRAFNRENKTPHGPLHDALTGYIRNFNRYGGKQREAITAALRKECCDLGRIVIDFNSQADILLGKCPDIVPLEPEREIQRFYNIMTRFFISLAKAENGLVIMLDDLHWSDMGTLKLMEELLGSIADAPLLAVGSFRHNEIGDDHPLRGMTRGSGPVEEIRVGHFNYERVASLVRSVIGMSDQDSAALADFVARKGGGNPLFSIEIIKHLISEKLIAHDGGAWAITAHRLEETDIPETIINTLLKRTESLGEQERDILSYAAAIGKIFDMDLLIRLRIQAGKDGSAQESEMRDIIAAIDRAGEQQIVARTPENAGKFSFIHDRIRDAFYERIGLEERKKLHRLIGQVLESERRGRTESTIFDLAYHFIEAGGEEKILEYAYPAALRARENYAHEDAIRYLTIFRNTAHDLFKKKGDQRYHEKWLESTKILIDTNLLIGEFDKGLKLVQEIVGFIPDNTGKSEIHLQITRAYFKKIDFAAAEQSARVGLELIGERIPRSVISYSLRILTQLAARFFRSNKKREISPVRSRQYKTMIWYYDCLFWIYYFTDVRKYTWTILRMLSLCEDYIGDSRELALSMMNYGLMLLTASRLTNKRGQRYVQRSYDISEKIGDEWGICYNLFVRGFSSILINDSKQSIMQLLKAVGIFSKIGDYFELMKSYHALFIKEYYNANYEHAMNYYTLSKNHVLDLYHESIFYTYEFPTQYYIEIGDYVRAKEELMKYRNYLLEKRIWSFYLCTCSSYLQYSLETGDIQSAYAIVQEGESIIRNNFLLPHFTSLFFVRHAQLLIQDFVDNHRNASGRERRAHIREIKKNCALALRKSKIWIYHHCVLHCDIGVFYSRLNKPANAEKWFTAGIRLCEKAGRRYELARCRYEYGVFLKETGHWHAAWEELVTASMIFDEIGVPVFRARISSHLGLSLEDGTGLESRITREKTLHMIGKSREFAACADLDGLLDRVLSLAMEISGARNGHVFLYDDSAGKLEHSASRSIDETAWHDYSWNIVQEVLATGKPIMAADAASDANLSSYRSVSHLSLRSVLCTPMEFNYMVSGVCYLDNHLAAGVFGDEEARLVALLLANASIAVENMLLRKRIDLGKIPTVPAEPRDENLGRVIAHLEEHFAEDITRGDLADIIGVHPDYLGKQFKGQTGKTIREYANELRIRWAMDRLNKTDEKIITIAFDAGFESLRTFNRIFFRTAGMTPAEYRGRKRKH